MTIDDALFYGVYLSQILLVSLYLPGTVVEGLAMQSRREPPA